MTVRGLNLQQAQQILQRALMLSTELSAAPLSIAILDAGGHLKSFASEDQVGIARAEIARGKAAAALGMGFGTRKLHNLIRQGILPEMFATCINGATNGNFVALPGGVLIYDKSDLLGAVGISGASSDLDERVAVRAIESCNFQAEP
ncbi:MAG: heme-binding protein [Pseudomonadales bacterium]|nr:heme-binding protein [Pseudomonadales bacterium]NRA17966.1 heme-binding protein [Oceanospirillaceae bacterium]